MQERGLQHPMFGGSLPACIDPYFPRDLLRFQPKFHDVLTCSWFNYLWSAEH